MPYLVPKLALCFHMLERELNLNCIELGDEKANKQEMDLRIGFAADLLAQCQTELPGCDDPSERRV